MNYLEIYKTTEAYVSNLFEKHANPNLLYHNLDHSVFVVDKAKEIAGNYQINEKDMLVLFLAAWFHDTGYLLATPEVHEEKSVEIMVEFMNAQQLDAEMIAAAEACVLSTKHPRSPQGLLEEILCDADTYNFGTKKFKKTNNLVFEEWKMLNPSLLRSDFDAGTISMLENHNFYTSYCKDNLMKTKNETIKKLKKKASKLEEKEDAEAGIVGITEKSGTRKGMQTMLRVTSSNHIQLSEMADSKANILISINAIIISVILSVLLRKLQTDPYLTIPTLIFLLSAVVTIVIAILATRPKVSTGMFEDADIKNKKANLLFFGNFHRMKQEEYESAMRIMMNDSDYLYSSMVADIYQLGKVLGKKYKLVRIAYNVFMIGIIVSVLAFAIASLIYTAPEASSQITTGGSPF